MKYLGILIDKKRLSNSLRKPVEDKFEKKMGSGRAVSQFRWETSFN